MYRKGLRHLFQAMLQDLWLGLLNFICMNGGSWKILLHSSRLKKPYLSHNFQTIRKLKHMFKQLFALSFILILVSFWQLIISLVWKPQQLWPKQRAASLTKSSG